MRILDRFLIVLVGFLYSISTFSQNPNWSVNSANFSLDASVIGVLKIDDVVSTDTNDQIAVFDANNEIRGVANVSFSASLNKHLFFLTLLSNTNGDTFSFRVYDASEDKVFEVSEISIAFEANKVFGTNDSPFPVNVNKPLSTKINEIIGLKCYPNPLKDNLYINANEVITKVHLYSVLGKEVLVFQPNQTNVNLNVKNLKPGIYLLNIKTNQKTSTRKIVKN